MNKLLGSSREEELGLGLTWRGSQLPVLSLEVTEDCDIALVCRM